MNAKKLQETEAKHSRKSSPTLPPLISKITESSGPKPDAL